MTRLVAVAPLAGGAESPLDDAVHGLVHVGVGQHDHGVLPTHLALHLFQPLCALGVDAGAYLRGAGEGDAFHRRVGHPRVTHHGPGAGDQVEHPRREAGVFENLHQLDGAERGRGGGFEDQGVAAYQGRGDLPGGYGDGEVPRSDDPHYA